MGSIAEKTYLKALICKSAPKVILFPKNCQMICFLVIFGGNLCQYMDSVSIKIKRIYDGVEAATLKSQASFQIIQVSFELCRGRDSNNLKTSLRFPF